MELTELLTAAIHRNASDLHLSTGLAPMLRVHGDIQPLDLPALEATTPMRDMKPWLEVAGLDSASPKVWMDAYLAAFAIAAGWRLVTLDKDFNNFLPQGLDLALLSN